MDRIGRLLAAKPPKEFRERLAIAIYERPYGEWWGLATREERTAARRQADAAMELFEAEKA